MLINATKLIGFPVLSLHVGGPVAKVTSIIVDPNDLSIIAFKVDGPTIGRDDIGTILEETYPENIKNGGTSYQFFTGSSGSGLRIYYVPQDPTKVLTDEQVSEFRELKGGYYVTSNLMIEPGKKITAVFKHRHDY